MLWEVMEATGAPLRECPAQVSALAASVIVVKLTAARSGMNKSPRTSTNRDDMAVCAVGSRFRTASRGAWVR